MKTIYDIKQELERWKKLPPRLRAERVLRPGGGLVEILEVLTGRLEALDVVAGNRPESNYQPSGIVDVKPLIQESYGVDMQALVAVEIPQQPKRRGRPPKVNNDNDDAA